MQLINVFELKCNDAAIYKITCEINHKIYVGSAKNLRNRLKGHLSTLRRNVHKNKHLQAAFNKHGAEAFRFEILELVTDLSLLIRREQYWLDHTQCYERETGFNICIKAESSLGIKRSDGFKEKIKNVNLNRSPELKAKVSEAVKKANTGKISWNKGIKMWENRPCPKANLGRKFIGRKFSPDGYRRICESNSRPRGEEYSKKLSFIGSKIYYFLDPDGLELKIENLKQFCIKIGLNHSRMYQVAKGNEKQHRGWTLWMANEPIEKRA